MNRNNKILENTYFNLSKAGAYVGPDKLYKVLKSKGITHIGKHKVRKWLHNQDDYSLRRELRHSFRKVRVVVSGIDDQFDMDLADVSNISDENDGIKYLLFVIDIFSKYLWVEPLKNKTATEVVNALKNILNKGRQCNKIRSDNGKEFNNNIMKTFLKNEGIYYFTTQNSDTKANIVERVIKTIKNMMYRYFTKQRTHRFADVLQDIVDSYNATPHRSLNNIAPKDVNKDNEADIWAFMYLKPKKVNLKMKNRMARKYRFKVGDMVRISRINMIFDRSYDEHFTREIFKVRTRFRMQAIPMYRLKDFSDEPIKGNFYESELQKVEKDENALWFIEKKIKKRKHRGHVQWYVKFEGWPDKYNQWIDEKDIIEPTTHNK